MEKQYVLLSKAWYGDVCLKNMDYEDEVTFSIYDEATSLQGECCVKWYYLDGKLSPKVEVFADAWCLFAECNDLFLLLSKHHNEDLTPAQFIECLNKCGFKDNTPFERE